MANNKYPHLSYLSQMDIISIDKVGRLLIPARIRKDMQLEPDTKFLIVGSNNKILLERLDLDDEAKRLEEELKGVDIDKIAKEIRAELQEKIRREKPEIFARQ